LFSLARRVVLAMLALVLARVTDTWLTDAVFVVFLVNTVWYAGNSVSFWTATQARVTRPAGDFEVILESPGARTIDVVKLLRQSTDLEFEQARRMVDSAPSIVSSKVSYPDARELADRLGGLGAEASIRLPDSATEAEDRRPD
jgi:ribosomal protein L7/L12